MITPHSYLLSTLFNKDFIAFPSSMPTPSPLSHSPLKMEEARRECQQMPIPVSTHLAAPADTRCFLPVGRNGLPQRSLKEDSQGTDSDSPLSTQGRLPVLRASLLDHFHWDKNMLNLSHLKTKATFPSSYPLASSALKFFYLFF